MFLKERGIEVPLLIYFFNKTRGLVVKKTYVIHRNIYLENILCVHVSEVGETNGWLDERGINPETILKSHKLCYAQTFRGVFLFHHSCCDLTVGRILFQSMTI